MSTTRKKKGSRLSSSDGFDNLVEAATTDFKTPISQREARARAQAQESTKKKSKRKSKKAGSSREPRFVETVRGSSVRVHEMYVNRRPYLEEQRHYRGAGIVMFTVPRRAPAEYAAHFAADDAAQRMSYDARVMLMHSGPVANIEFGDDGGADAARRFALRLPIAVRGSAHTDAEDTAMKAFYHFTNETLNQSNLYRLYTKLRLLPDRCLWQPRNRVLLFTYRLFQDDDAATGGNMTSAGLESTYSEEAERKVHFAESSKTMTRAERRQTLPVNFLLGGDDYKMPQMHWVPLHNIVVGLSRPAADPLHGHALVATDDARSDDPFDSLARVRGPHDVYLPVHHTAIDALRVRSIFTHIQQSARAAEPVRLYA